MGFENVDSIITEIEKLEPKDGDIILLRFRKHPLHIFPKLPDDQIQLIAKRLKELNDRVGRKNALVCMHDDSHLEVLDEETMRQHGWFRIDKFIAADLNDRKESDAAFDDWQSAIQAVVFPRTAFRAGFAYGRTTARPEEPPKKVTMELIDLSAVVKALEAADESFGRGHPTFEERKLVRQALEQIKQLGATTKRRT